jgi:hypothetical protein
LKEYRNVWYMVAWANETKHKGGTNLFKINRIHKIETIYYSINIIYDIHAL